MKLENLRGRRFGKLLVVRKEGNIGGHARWRCLCDCGVNVLKLACNLKSGTKHCGCERYVLIPRAERFWSKVARREPDACWPWTAAVSAHHGYGRFGEGTGVRNAHTVAWELDRGRKLPRGKVVRHRCDNRVCCNPRHLLMGTQGANVRDAVRRGRMPPPEKTRHVGEDHGRAKLTDIDVIAIRAARSQGMTLRELAEVYDVHPETVGRAARGVNWKHVECAGYTAMTFPDT